MILKRYFIPFGAADQIFGQNTGHCHRFGHLWPSAG
jgi:hypothetical protein